MALVLMIPPTQAQSRTTDALFAKRLYRTGLELIKRTRYLEAIEMLEEAGNILEKNQDTKSLFYADALYAKAEAKIKARIHQGFPAIYVKTALKDTQMANQIRAKNSDALPLKLAESYYLEGYIHKRFFMRGKLARELFMKCIKLDPGHSAAKRELSEVLLD
jgi:tetratricopeptide (TPR) repeat protein